MPNSITCAVNMKMISNTRTTSTNGVTLISARLDEAPFRRRDPNPPPFTDIAMALFSEGALRHVQKFHGEIVHAGAHFTNFVTEKVIKDGCGNGRHQTERSRYQGFRDSRRNRAQTGGPLSAESLESRNNAGHCAE